MRILLLIVSFTAMDGFAGHELARATEPFAEVGTYALTFLTIPTGTRNHALGQAGTADDTHPSNQYYNPATLITFDKAGFAFNFMDWSNYFSLTNFSANFGAVSEAGDLEFMWAGSLLYTSMSIDHEPAPPVYVPGGTEKDFDACDRHTTLALAAGLGAGRTDAGLGLAVKMARSELGGETEDTWCFDVGTIVKAEFGRPSAFRFIPSVGLSALHLGGTVNYYSRESKLPRQLRLGLGLRIEAPALAQTENLLGYPAPLVSVSLVGDFVDRADYYEAIGGGIEFGVIDIAFLRVGRHNTLHDDQNGRTSYGLGLAWTISEFRMSLDYSGYDLDWPLNDVDAYGLAVTYAY